jgi:hypothetical protein
MTNGLSLGGFFLRKDHKNWTLLPGTNVKQLELFFIT